MVHREDYEKAPILVQQVILCVSFPLSTTSLGYLIITEDDTVTQDGTHPKVLLFIRPATPEQPYLPRLRQSSYHLATRPQCISLCYGRDSVCASLRYRRPRYVHSCLRQQKRYIGHPAT